MQLIGSAKAMFAKNGVLVVDRADSAVMMWEQDEISDLGFELNQIQMNVANEAGAHIHNGYMEKLQALFDAEGLSIQAMGAAINAHASSLAAANALTQARQAEYSSQTSLLTGQASASAANAQSQAAGWNLIASLGSDVFQGAGIWMK
jgi:hypothetical protein